MPIKIHGRSCTADEGAATAMTCLFHLGGATHGSRLPTFLRRGVGPGPSGHAVKRPRSVAERLPLLDLVPIPINDAGCWIDSDRQWRLMVGDDGTAVAAVP